jgi:thymidylate synthase ThyX
MTYQAKILKDSIAEFGNLLKPTRLVTLEVTLPRVVLAEYNTHRMLSRNSASSRARPIQKVIKDVMENPYIPEKWGKNQSGMQAYQDVLPESALEAEKEWLKARDLMVQQAEMLLKIGIHKQITNRLLEPFSWQTIICTATEWSNFLHLRNHPDADPAIQKPAQLMEEAIKNSEPQLVKIGEWHAPLLNIGMENEEDLILEQFKQDGIKKVSTGRCARVSYLTHDGARDFNKDIELHDGLIENCHMSPAEHVATPLDLESNDHYQLAMMSCKDGEYDYWFGNFRNWIQYRKMIPGEFDMLGFKKDN